MLKVNPFIVFLAVCLASAAVSPLMAQQAIVEHFVGSEGGVGTRDGLGAEARFNRPRGIWSDGAFAYVADQSNSTIRRITLATGEVRTIAGTPQQPQPDRISSPSAIWGQGSFLYFIDGVVVRRVSIETG